MAKKKLPVNPIVGERVEKLRKEKGMTQAALAERLGVKPLTISRWYRGETPLPERARFELEKIVLEK